MLHVPGGRPRLRGRLTAGVAGRVVDRGHDGPPAPAVRARPGLPRMQGPRAGGDCAALAEAARRALH
eukprot:6847468-Lingulodinium_polyedra.AAC.1